MTSTALYRPDLAGMVSTNPGPRCLTQRIRTLVDRYVTQAVLRDRLEDLPQQFQQPHVRPWSLIAWNTISPEHYPC